MSNEIKIKFEVCEECDATHLGNEKNKLIAVSNLKKSGSLIYFCNAVCFWEWAAKSVRQSDRESIIQ